MIDGLTLTATVNGKALLEDKRFKWVLFGDMDKTPNTETYEPKLKGRYRKCKYRGLSFCLYNGKGSSRYKFLIIKGSLHKFSHSSNHTDFSLKNCNTAIIQLSNLIGVAPHKINVSRMEYGLNFTPSIKIDKWMQSLLRHGTHPFIDMNKGEQGVIGKIALKQKFSVKAYDKSKQLGLNYPLARFEINAKKSSYINRKQAHEKYSPNIKTLNQLALPETWYILLLRLLLVYHEILKLEPINKKALSKKDKELYKKCQQRKVSFERLKKQLAERTFFNKVNRFRWIIETYNTQNWHDEILQLLASKGVQLINEKLALNHRYKNVPFFNIYCMGNYCQFLKNNSPYFVNIPQPILAPRKCLSCGNDISMQKQGSVFCSKKYYPENAKRCRNKNSNRRYRIKTKATTTINQMLNS